MRVILRRMIAVPTYCVRVRKGLALAGASALLFAGCSSGTDSIAERADVVVTMGCGDECPYFPGKRYLDWALPDPKDQEEEAVRATRDEIARRVRDLVVELDRPGGSAETSE